MPEMTWSASVRVGAVMDSLSGKLLVASRALADPHFAQAVVLLVHHDEEGAYGVVVNRRSQAQLADIWEQVGTGPCPVCLPLWIGGPVDGPLVAVHATATFGEREIGPGLYFTARKDLVAALLQEACEPLKIVIRSAGWSGGQLEQELGEGSWEVIEATQEQVFGDETVLWQQLTRHLADQLLIDSLRIRHVPRQPWHN